MKHVDLDTLKQFSGTERYYKHFLNPSIRLTDGVFYCIEHGLAWFIDIIVTESLKLDRANADFQSWTLTVSNSAGLITVEDGNGNKIKSRKIEFTDFPHDKITIWKINTILLLPSEY